MLGAGGVDCTEFRTRLLELYPLPEEVLDDSVRDDDVSDAAVGAVEQPAELAVKE
jgi:hypothetical protein